MQRVMTVEEVAGYLRVSSATVYKMLRSQELPGLRIGRSWRVRRDILDEWMATHSRESIGAGQSVWKTPIAFSEITDAETEV